MQTLGLYNTYATVTIPTSTDIYEMLRETSQHSWEVKSRSLTSFFANISPKSLPHVPASVGVFQNRLPAPLALPHYPAEGLSIALLQCTTYANRGKHCQTHENCINLNRPNSAKSIRL